jgi:hypothetical protein
MALTGSQNCLFGWRYWAISGRPPPRRTADLVCRLMAACYRLADAFQPEDPLVYGGQVLHAV